MAQNQLAIANAALRKLGAEEVSSLSDSTKSAQVMNTRVEPAKQAVLRVHPWNFATRRIKLITRVAGTTVTAITAASPPEVTSTAHGLLDGDQVVLEDIGGMTEVEGVSYRVSASAANTFELEGVDGTAYTTYTTGGTARRRPAFDFGNYFALPTDCLRVLPITDGTKYRVEGRFIATNESSLELKYVQDIDLDDNNADPLFAECLSSYLAWDCCYAILQSNSAKDRLWAEYGQILSSARFTNATEGGHQQVVLPQTYINGRQFFSDSNAYPLRG